MDTQRGLNCAEWIMGLGGGITVGPSGGGCVLSTVLILLFLAYRLSHPSPGHRTDLSCAPMGLNAVQRRGHYTRPGKAASAVPHVTPALPAAAQSTET